MAEDQLLVRINPDVLPTGSDLGIVNAARKSYGKRSEWANEVDYLWGSPPILKDKDKRLLEFLARGMTVKDFESFVHQVPAPDTEGHTKELIEMLWQWRNTPTHDTPFNHGFFSFEVKAPLFVRSHLVKHEYLIMSEYSRRYITDDVEFYKHKYREAAVDKKQGSGGTHSRSETYETLAEINNKRSLAFYDLMVSDGIAPEQARGQLPQDLMTSWTWSGSMGAFASMCRLRLGSDTQKETSYVVSKVYEELKKQFPIAAPLLVEGVL